MRLLFFAPRFHTNLYYRVLALQDVGHVVKVLVLYKGQSEYHKDIEVQQLKLSFISRMVSFWSSKFRKSTLKTNLELNLLSSGLWSTYKEVRKFRPDYLFIKAYLNLFSETLLLVAKVLNIPSVMLTQTQKDKLKGSRTLLKLYLKHTQMLGVKAYISPVKKNTDIFNDLNVPNAYYIPFVYPNVPLQKQGNRNDFITILSIGKFVKRKDQTLLIRAFAELRKQYNLKLTFIGERADEAYYQSVKRLIYELKLEDYVEIHTKVPYDEMGNYFRNAQLFVLPSYREPAAYSPVEAMAYGLPVIVSNDCGTACYIEKGVNGEVFQRKSLNSLIYSIMQVISSCNSLKQYSENASLFHSKYHIINDFEIKILQIIKTHKKKVQH